MSQPPTFPPKKLPGEVDAAPRAETPGNTGPQPRTALSGVRCSSSSGSNAADADGPDKPLRRGHSAPVHAPAAVLARLRRPRCPQATASAAPQRRPGGGTILAACPPSDARHGSGPQPLPAAGQTAAPSAMGQQRPWQSPAGHTPQGQTCPAALWVKHRRARPQRRKALFPAVRDSALPAFPRQTRTFVLPHRLWAAQRARHGFCARRFAPEQPHFAQLCLSPSRQHTARDAPRHLPLSQRFADFG